MQLKNQISPNSITAEKSFGGVLQSKAMFDIAEVAKTLKNKNETFFMQNSAIIADARQGVFVYQDKDFHWEIKSEPKGSLLRLYFNGHKQRLLGNYQQLKSYLCNFPQKTKAKPND